MRIAWARQTIEVDARVVMRAGPLELLVCTPGTREHESVLVINASATHVYQAMGLIGLTPGSPVRYDESSDKLIAPTGDRLQLLIRHQRDGKPFTHPAGRWLADAESRQRIESIDWVFAGSRRTPEGSRAVEGGRLAVESEGTVVALVDFDSALITVSSLHTSANEALWIVANTDAIPPIGTPCTLIIRPVVQQVAVIVRSDGTVRVHGEPWTLQQVASLAQPAEDDDRPVVFLLQGERATDADQIERVTKALVRLGVERDAIKRAP